MDPASHYSDEVRSSRQELRAIDGAPGVQQVQLVERGRPGRQRCEGQAPAFVEKSHDDVDECSDDDYNGGEPEHFGEVDSALVGAVLTEERVGAWASRERTEARGVVHSGQRRSRE